MIKLLILIILMTLQVSFAIDAHETRVIKAEPEDKGEPYLETKSLLKNSFNVGLSHYIRCDWSELSQYKAKLDSCYAYDFGLTGLFTGNKYEILTKFDIILNAKNCTVSTNGSVVGIYYGGYCKGRIFDDGFKITGGFFEINEYDYTISLSEKNTFMETVILKDNSSAPVEGRIELEKHTLLWNSANVGLKHHVKCEWVQIDHYISELKDCYENNSSEGTERMIHILLNVVVGENSSFETKYTTQSSEKITYNAHTCELKMGDKSIGNYFGGHCSDLLERPHIGKGIEITNAQLIINESDLTLTIR